MKRIFFPVAFALPRLCLFDDSYSTNTSAGSQEQQMSDSEASESDSASQATTTEGVLVSESTGDQGRIEPVPAKFRIVETEPTLDVKTITIRISGPAEKIDKLAEAAEGKCEISYFLIESPKL
jgi:hypothetical protein